MTHASPDLNLTLDDHPEAQKTHKKLMRGVVEGSDLTEAVHDLLDDITEQSAESDATSSGYSHHKMREIQSNEKVYFIFNKYVVDQLSLGNYGDLIAKGGVTTKEIREAIQSHRAGDAQWQTGAKHRKRFGDWGIQRYYEIRLPVVEGEVLNPNAEDF